MRDGLRFRNKMSLVETYTDGEISASATHRNRCHPLKLLGSKAYRNALWTNFRAKLDVKWQKAGVQERFGLRQGHEESRIQTMFDV